MLAKVIIVMTIVIVVVIVIAMAQNTNAIKECFLQKTYFYYYIRYTIDYKSFRYFVLGCLDLRVILTAAQ